MNNGKYKIIDFKEVNFEFKNIEYYDEITNQSNLNIELGFTPSYDKQKVSILFHIRLSLNVDDNIKNQFLHADFVSIFHYNGKDTDKIIMSKEIYNEILQLTLNLSKGYLLSRVHILNLSKIILSLNTPQNYIESLSYFNNNEVRI